MPPRSLSPLRRLPVLALHLGCALALPALWCAAALAQHPPAAAARLYAIPPGPLAAALERFLGESGVLLAGTAELARGRSSPGLQGRYEAAEGLRRLLAGTGLQAVPARDGSYSLRPAAPAAPPAAPTGAAPAPAAAQRGSELPEVRVSATRERDATTEGSGSYASGSVALGKAAQPVREIPQSVSVITRQQMDDQNLSTLEDALKQATGVTVQAWGSGDPYFYARGYTLEAQFDGIPSNTSLSTLPQFDLAMYDRIEVLRGPAGVLQGSGNPAGTVNLVRKRPLDQFKLAGNALLGSWQQAGGDVDVTGPLNAERTLRGRAVLAAQSRDFFYDQAHTDRRLLYGILEYDLAPRTRAALSANVQREEAAPYAWGLPTYASGAFLAVPRSTYAGADWNRLEQTNRELLAELSHGFGEGWTAKAAARRRESVYDNKAAYAFGAIAPATGRGSWRVAHGRYEYDWNGLDLNLSGPVEWFGRRHTLLAGLNYDRYHYTYRSAPNLTLANVELLAPVVSEPAMPFTSGTEAEATQTGLYGQARLQLAEPLHLVLGGRFSRYRAQSRGVAPSTATAWRTDGEERSEFTPYAGFTFDLARQLTAYASYAEIFSPQTQRTASGALLDPRTGAQVEAGVKGEFLDGRLNASLAVFRIRDRNRAVSDAANPGFSLAVGEVESQGWEAEVSGRPLPQLDLIAGYTKLTTRYRDDPVNAGLAFRPQEPRHNLKLWAKYRFEAEALAGFTLGAGARIVSETSNGATIRQGGYAVADLQLGYRFGPRLSASFTVSNLFDRAYYRGINSPSLSNYPGEPRAALLSLRASY